MKTSSNAGLILIVGFQVENIAFDRDSIESMAIVELTISSADSDSIPGQTTYLTNHLNQIRLKLSKIL